MKWTFPSLNLIGSIFRKFVVKNQNRMANSVDPDETAHFESSHQGLHCLHRDLVVSAAERVKPRISPKRGINIK